VSLNWILIDTIFTQGERLYLSTQPFAAKPRCATQLDQQFAAHVEQALACSSTFSAASEACSTWLPSC
jgi:hypothetical protein